MSENPLKQKKNSTKQTLKQLGTYLKPFTPLIILSFLLSGISAVGSLYVPIMVGKMLDLMIGVGDVDIFKVILPRAFYFKKLAVPLSALFGNFNLLFARKVSARY